MIHDADMCLHLFGKPNSVSALGYESLEDGIDIMSYDNKRGLLGFDECNTVIEAILGENGFLGVLFADIAP